MSRIDSSLACELVIFHHHTVSPTQIPLPPLSHHPPSSLFTFTQYELLPSTIPPCPYHEECPIVYPAYNALPRLSAWDTWNRHRWPRSSGRQGVGIVIDGDGRGGERIVVTENAGEERKAGEKTPFLRGVGKGGLGVRTRGTEGGGWSPCGRSVREIEDVQGGFVGGNS